MKMIYTISWRNVWRSKLRTFVVVFSIALGIWGGLSTIALSFGLNKQRTDSSIKSSISHIQIHHPEFTKDRNAKYTISDWKEVSEELEQDTNVRAYTYRVELNGMLSSAAGGNGVSIHGIDPIKEKAVTDLWEKVEDGGYLDQDRKNQILISTKIADKLNVKMRSKLVLTFQDGDGNIQTALFRVSGLYKTNSTPYDEGNIFVKSEDLWRLFGRETVHEIALLAPDIERVDSLRNVLRRNHTDLLVEDWKEVAPELAYADQTMKSFLYIFLAILMLAMSFGIVNTMMMAVLERKHELGMLMAVGMNKGRVFRMILLETLYIGMAGGPLGILLAWLTISHFEKSGLDLGAYSKGLESVGIDSVVYPALEPNTYLIVAIMVMITALLSAISPARRALKLNPTEAIRAI